MYDCPAFTTEVVLRLLPISHLPIPHQDDERKAVLILRGFLLTLPRKAE